MQETWFTWDFKVQVYYTLAPNVLASEVNLDLDDVCSQKSKENIC